MRNFSLDADFTNCDIIQASLITMLKCPFSATFFITNDLYTSNETANFSQFKIDNSTTFAHESKETLLPGTITYIIDTKVYRAYLVNNQSLIVTKQIFSIPFSADQIGDVQVHDNFTLIKYGSNDTFQAFLRPRPEGNANVTKPKSGMLSLSPAPDQIVFKVKAQASYDPQKLFIYLLPNWNNIDNYLFVYNVTQFFANNTILDIQIIQQSRRIFLGRGNNPQALEILGTSFIMFGYPDRNNYNGSMELYETQNYTKVYTINGDTSGSQFGAAFQIIRQSQNVMDFAVLQAVSSIQAGIASVRALRNDTTGNWSFQLQNQAIKSPVAGYQKTLKFATYNTDTVLVKYDSQRNLMFVRICDYLSYYNSSACLPCDPSSQARVSLSSQSPSCATCKDLYISTLTTSSPYNQQLMWERCPDFDPSTLNPITPPPKPPPKPNGGQNDTTNSTSSDSESKGINVIAVAIGIIVPVFVLGGIGIGVWLYCRNKKKKDAENLAEMRKKKKEDGGEVQRKKATDFDKTQVEKKMDEEIMEQIKQLEKEDAKKSDQNKIVIPVSNPKPQEIETVPSLPDIVKQYSDGPSTQNLIPQGATNSHSQTQHFAPSQPIVNLVNNDPYYKTQVPHQVVGVKDVQLHIGTGDSLSEDEEDDNRSQIKGISQLKRDNTYKIVDNRNNTANQQNKVSFSGGGFGSAGAVFQPPPSLFPPLQPPYQAGVNPASTATALNRFSGAPPSGHTVSVPTAFNQQQYSNSVFAQPRASASRPQEQDLNKKKAPGETGDNGPRPDNNDSLEFRSDEDSNI
ncbi:hypothetical protein FGO68_gene7533 [Halteria grandinella]|uniref:Transmembrane protein n=1 Tax=Halteria grandinella TaxID=5974 RepID=A0A8J8T6V4_HALGN|nr:hypothetical protein FGO68_gene7533 [Halteria grandinella]